MNLLKRELAPVVEEAWALIDKEARGVLASHLAGRRLVDFSGPHGWDYAAVNTGMLKPISTPRPGGAEWRLRDVQPLAEVRIPIELDVANLDLAARGSTTIDLEPVVSAAKTIAHDEDDAIFSGADAAGIVGIIGASTHDPVDVESPLDYPKAVIGAADRLRRAGIGGPYGVALAPDVYNELFAATHDGYPVVRQVERFIEGPIVKAPSLTGGVVLSLRGGDYQLVVGQDHSIGYLNHDQGKVSLFMTESFTFRVIEPAAAVELRHG